MNDCIMLRGNHRKRSLLQELARTVTGIAGIAGTLLAGSAIAQSPLILEPYLLDDLSALPALAGEDIVTDGSEALNQALSSLSLYEQSIDLTERQEGPFSMALAEQLTALGDTYQQLGEHDQAITAYESAQYILRVNSGLFTLDQTALVSSMVDSFLALGQQREASSLQEYRYYLYQKNYQADDPEFISASLQQAQWYLDSYRRDPTDLSGFMNTGARTVPSMQSNVALYDNTFRAFVFVPRFDLFGFNSPAANFNMISTYPNLKLQNDPDFYQARQMLLAVAESESATADLSEPLRVQYALAETAYLAKEQLEYIEDQVNFGTGRCFYCNVSDTVRMKGREYANGREALEAIISSLEASPGADIREVTGARLDLADWHLAFGYAGRAHELYVGIYAELVAAGMPETDINVLMNPTSLLLLPGFVEQPYTPTAWGFESGSGVPYDGYMDVELKRNAEGEFEDVTLLGSSDNTPGHIQALLLELLKTQNSRPTLESGVPLEEETLYLRYYYAL